LVSSPIERGEEDRYTIVAVKIIHFIVMILGEYPHTVFWRRQLTEGYAVS